MNRNFRKIKIDGKDLWFSYVEGTLSPECSSYFRCWVVLKLGLKKVDKIYGEVYKELPEGEELSGDIVEMVEFFYNRKSFKKIEKEQMEKLFEN